MSRRAATVLRALVVLVGIAVLAFMLYEPHLEGRNANATLFRIYFQDPFLAYAYLASVPFFAGLWQAYRALGLAGRGQAYSPEAAKSLRIIRMCAIVTIGLVWIGVAILFSMESDDRPPLIMMGTLATLGAVAVATVATKLEQAVKRRGR